MDYLTEACSVETYLERLMKVGGWEIRAAAVVLLRFYVHVAGSGAELLHYLDNPGLEQQALSNHRYTTGSKTYAVNLFQRCKRAVFPCSHSF